MTQEKIITQLEISCNVAFVDICNTHSKFYLLCCSGQQYPNYPCYGSNESGYTHHSSICRSALSSGVKCGEQFFAFFVGESCVFPASVSNGVKSLFYGDWSRAYKIKKVENVFSEHKKMISSIEKMKIAEKNNNERISNLEFECGALKVERENLETKMQRETEEKHKAIQKQAQLTKVNEQLAKDLSEARKYPREEFLSMKKERIDLHKRIQILEAQKKSSETESKRIREILTRFEEREQKQNKSFKLQKELALSAFVEKLQDFRDKIETKSFSFLEGRDKTEQQEKRVKAMSGMQRIMEQLNLLQINLEDGKSEIEKLLLQGIKIEKDQNNDSESIEKCIKRLKETINKEWPTPNENSKTKENLLSKIDSFEEFTKKSSESTKKLNKISPLLFEKTLFESKNAFQKHTDSSNHTKNSKSYEGFKNDHEKEDLNLSEMKKRKDVSGVLGSSKKIESLIREKILPQNKRIRTFLAEKRKAGRSLMKESKACDLKNKVEELDQAVKTAEDDLKQIDTLSPLPKEIGKTLKKKTEEAAEKVSVLKKKLLESTETLSKILEEFSEQYGELLDAQLRSETALKELESTRFEILRWEETKEDHKDGLREFISERKAVREYIAKMNSVIKKGNNILFKDEKLRAEMSRTEERTLVEEYEKYFSLLYESVKNDMMNRRKQLKRISSLQNTLKTQLDEAIEVMDVETVNSLEEQIKKLPKKESTLKESISKLEESLESMEKERKENAPTDNSKIKDKESKLNGMDDESY